jgi:hypothetical protein
MKFRNKNFILFPNSTIKDKIHVYISDKYYTGNIELSSQTIKELKKLLDEHIQ